jgi:hypothetical protein
MYIGDTSMVCKICNSDKAKEPVIRKDTTRFVDESGRMWNGKQCPDCYKEYNRQRMRSKRKAQKESKT